MTLRMLVLVAISAVALCAATVAGSRPGPGETCEARPIVEQFVAALKAGDLATLDSLFAGEQEEWRWYSISDRAGQRLGAAAMRRSSLRAYFASRIAKHEQFRLLRLDENASGNFGMLVERRADDLRDGRWVRRGGKGWVSCTVGKIAVLSLGGAPPPSTFGPCPRGALTLTPDLGPAGSAVLRFLQRTYSEMSPALDIRGARVVWAKRAAGLAEGYTARVKCGIATQQRTAVVLVRLPRIASREPNALLRFYTSRVPSGWLVWRLV